MRVLSAYYPQSNGRAEAAVKTAKRILMDNTGPGGTLNTDKVSVALLQYHNTPLREINRSPAQLATGRQLRDGVLTDKQHYKVNKNWCRTLHEMELKLAKRQRKREIDRGIHRTLSQLGTGNRVWVQDPKSLRWDNSGTVAEVLSYRQYTVRLDGSRRLSLRNRKHLKVISEPVPANTTTDRGNLVTLASSQARGTTPSTVTAPDTQQVSRPKRTTRQPERLTYHRKQSNRKD